MVCFANIPYFSSVKVASEKFWNLVKTFFSLIDYLFGNHVILNLFFNEI